LIQAGMVERQSPGVSVFDRISGSTIFELCDSVCDRIVEQLQTNSEEIEQLKAFQSRL